MMRALALCLLLLNSCRASEVPAESADAPQRATAEPAPSLPLIAAARSRVGVTLYYDPAYVGLSYPGGDVPADRGVCTDVVIRALRTADSLDLQQLVHLDMKANFKQYPTRWGHKRPDKNIDHRRVPNLRRYFERKGYELPLPKSVSGYQPGDIVTCIVGENLPHIMIVSDNNAPDGEPLILHNIGSGTQEERGLSHFQITGRYRIQ